jgi:predicted HTH domain antitoxin
MFTYEVSLRPDQLWRRRLVHPRASRSKVSHSIAMTLAGTAMAVKLFEMKRLSSGQAALLAGIDRITFLMRLSENGAAMIDMSAEELGDDVRDAGPK